MCLSVENLPDKITEKCRRPPSGASISREREEKEWRGVRRRGFRDSRFRVARRLLGNHISQGAPTFELRGRERRLKPTRGAVLDGTEPASRLTRQSDAVVYDE